ncbi:MAG: ribosome small subunit-dependent GTPase A [Clostridia bacterium]|nr:ribosome small subunit-dependent GTPase A [Clostridia bacterium]
MYQGFGRVINSNGGLFTVRLFSDASREPMPLDGMTVTGRGRGSLHRKGALLVGDLVDVSYDHTAFSLTEDGKTVCAEDGTGLAIDRIRTRKNALIRPPMANLDILFVTLAAASPEPILETVDKLLCIAEHNGIEPVIVVTKSELSSAYAEELAGIYRLSGFEVFCVGEGMDHDALRARVCAITNGKIAAFSGASGVGKSTLLNRLFPELHLETGEISRRIERGKNTTRQVSLYPLSNEETCGYLADTPGFTMLDFERFDFFDKEALPQTFREFVPYIGECRYTKCSHTKEEGCAILGAVKRGEIAPTRHQSFLSLYEVLKKKTKW